MASGKSEGDGAELSAESLELHRDVFSVLAHELGGIAGALDLRAEVLAKLIPAQDLDALRTLANEIRTATRTVRFVRGDVPGTLSPTRRQTLGDWWAFTAPFTRVVLPREAVVDAHVGDSNLSGASASALTWMWLAACKDLTERGLVTTCTIVLHVQPTNGTEGIALLADIAARDLSARGESTSRWERYAATVARELGISAPSWQQDGSTVRWSCVIDRQ